MTEVTVKPFGHYVLIELVEVKQVSKGGIILTDATKEQKAAQFAKVLAIGPTAFIGVDGCDPRKWPTTHPFSEMQPHQIWGIEIGSTVGLKRYEGSDVNVAGIKNYRVIPDTELTHGVEGSFEITKADF
jgi:hypothetical protein